MRILLLGGTGLISVGIIKHLVAREDTQVTCFNRGQSDPKAAEPLPNVVRQVHGDRNGEELLAAFAEEQFDVVIDMICFKPEQAEMTLALCKLVGAKQLVFCSTVCTYGVVIPPGVVIDETFPQNPISDYGKNKLACEQLVMQANEKGDLAVTIVRPSSTYGEGGHLIDNLEFDPAAWDRIRRDEPVLCAGDGLGLWNSTHRDDVGKLFAYACGNEKTFGQAYNATRETILTWRDYYHQAAEFFDKRPKLLFMPAGWIIAHDPDRFGLLREITQFHGPYTSAKAMRDVPEFRCEIDFREGAARTLSSLVKRDKLKPGNDPLYDDMVKKALAAGMEAVEV